MRLYPALTAALLVLWGVAHVDFTPVAVTRAQDDGPAKGSLQERRKRLAALEAGMTADEVIRAVGKPDEVRRIRADQLLDGMRLYGETERWAYGILGKGMFAAVGYVGMDSNGKVVAAVPADDFARAWWPGPVQVAARTDSAMETPSKRSLQLGPVKTLPAAGGTTARLQTTVTLKNAGTERFELKHDAASAMRRFFVIEIQDAQGNLLFREDQMRYHSPVSIDPARWPVLSVPTGKEIPEELILSPAHGFGPLPPGPYSVRVYFPLEKGKYYPSNRVPFDVSVTK